MSPDRMTEEGGLSTGLKTQVPFRRVGLTGESSVREEMIGLEFAQIAYFLISLNYLLNIL